MEKNSVILLEILIRSVNNRIKNGESKESVYEFYLKVSKIKDEFQDMYTKLLDYIIHLN